MKNGNNSYPIRPNEPTEEDAERIIEDMISAMIDHETTPRWTHPVLEQVQDADHTYPLVHLREDVRLLIRIMEGGNEKEIVLWLRDRVIPEWMQSSLALFKVADNRFDRQRYISQAEVLEDILTIKCGFD